MERHYTEVLVDTVPFPDDIRRQVFTPTCSCGWTSPSAWHRRRDADNDADEHVRCTGEGR